MWFRVEEFIENSMNFIIFQSYTYSLKICDKYGKSSYTPSTDSGVDLLRKDIQVGLKWVAE